MSQVFDAYAAYYDLLYRDKDYAAEAAFVGDLLQQHGGITSGSLLELGCGTGKHAEHFAKLGYRVYGLDASNQMLAYAEKKKQVLSPAVASLLEFSFGDIRTYRAKRRYDMVVSLFHVMSYQTTNSDLMATFHTAAAHLARGGLFLFDFWYGPAVLTQKPEVRVKRLENDSLRMVRIAEPHWRPRENIVDVNFQVWIETLRTGEITQLCEVHAMRYFFEPEVDFMLQQAGFRVEVMFGWLEDTPPSTQNWSATAIAVRQ